MEISLPRMASISSSDFFSKSWPRYSATPPAISPGGTDDQLQDRKHADRFPAAALPYDSQRFPFIYMEGNSVDSINRSLGSMKTGTQIINFK